MWRSKVEVDRYVSSVQNSSPSLKEVRFASFLGHAIILDSSVLSSRSDVTTWTQGSKGRVWIRMHLLDLYSVILYVRVVCSEEVKVRVQDLVRNAKASISRPTWGCWLPPFPDQVLRGKVLDCEACSTIPTGHLKLPLRILYINKNIQSVKAYVK